MTAMKHFRQLVTAIKYCHDKHPNVHLDIRLETMKFKPSESGVIVCDFRMPNFLTIKESEDSIRDHYKEMRYLPPEILVNIDDDDKTFIDQKLIDVWLTGIALYMFITKEYPFDDDSLPKCNAQLLQNKPKLKKIQNIQIRELI